MVGYVTTIKGKLLENETLKEQAASNSEQQFAVGDFKDTRHLLRQFPSDASRRHHITTVIPSLAGAQDLLSLCALRA